MNRPPEPSEFVGALIGPETGEPLVRLSAQGDWSAADPDAGPIADILNALEHPLRDRQIGDHHTPFGVAALRRAAGNLGLSVKLEVEVPPPPENGVN